MEKTAKIAPKNDLPEVAMYAYSMADSDDLLKVRVHYQRGGIVDSRAVSGPLWASRFSRFEPNFNNE